MNVEKVFNAAMDRVIAAPVYVWKLVALAVVVLLGFAFITRGLGNHDARERELGALAVRDSLSATVLARYHRTIDTLGKRIDRETVTVVQTTHRLDTLWRQLPEKIITRTDTVQALNAIPVLRATTDSAIHACSELVSTCAQYRTYAESVFHEDSSVMRGLRERLAHETRSPSKYQTVLKWVEIAGAFYLGRKLK